MAETSAATWSINTLERDLPDGTVYTIHWSVSLQDGEYSSGAYGTTGLGPADPDNFIPYDQLTQKEVLGWLKATLGEETVAAYEASLARQIEEQKNPTHATGLPWN